MMVHQNPRVVLICITLFVAWAEFANFATLAAPAPNGVRNQHVQSSSDGRISRMRLPCHPEGHYIQLTHGPDGAIKQPTPIPVDVFTLLEDFVVGKILRKRFGKPTKLHLWGLNSDQILSIADHNGKIIARYNFKPLLSNAQGMAGLSRVRSGYWFTAPDVNGAESQINSEKTSPLGINPAISDDIVTKAQLVLLDENPVSHKVSRQLFNEAFYTPDGKPGPLYVIFGNYGTRIGCEDPRFTEERVLKEWKEHLQRMESSVSRSPPALR